MLQQIVAFTTNHAGLEKTLRLLQGIAIVATSGLVVAPEPWLQARDQFALARRYFRLFGWYPAGRRALDETRKRGYSNYDTTGGAVMQTLEIAKWQFLTTYLFVEMFVITEALGITNYGWGTQVQLEADKFWFYSIATSIVWGISRFFFVNTLKLETPGILIQLTIDACDIFIPGYSVGWIKAEPMMVGCASITSSILAGREIWKRVVH